MKALGVFIGIVVYVIVIALYSCLVVGRRADDELEKMQKADCGEPEEDDMYNG